MGFYILKFKKVAILESGEEIYNINNKKKGQYGLSGFILALMYFQLCAKQNIYL